MKSSLWQRIEFQPNERFSTFDISMNSTWLAAAEVKGDIGKSFRLFERRRDSGLN